VGAGAGPFVTFMDDNGNPVRVTPSNPLPTSGGGMDPEDISAEAPVTWDEGTSTIGFTPAAAVANATDEPSAVTQLNALLASLRAAGVIAT
jgi:hypothetical protein